MAKFDAEEFIKRLKENERKCKEIADKNCAEGRHLFGAAQCAGGRIYSRCRNCGHVHSVEDKPMNI